MKRLAFVSAEEELYLVHSLISGRVTSPVDLSGSSSEKAQTIQNSINGLLNEKRVLQDMLGDALAKKKESKGKMDLLHKLSKIDKQVTDLMRSRDKAFDLCQKKVVIVTLHDVAQEKYAELESETLRLGFLKSRDVEVADLDYVRFQMMISKFNIVVIDASLLMKLMESEMMLAKDFELILLSGFSAVDAPLSEYHTLLQQFIPKAADLCALFELEYAFKLLKDSPCKLKKLVEQTRDSYGLNKLLCYVKPQYNKQKTLFVRYGGIKTSVPEYYETAYQRVKELKSDKHSKQVKHLMEQLGPLLAVKHAAKLLSVPEIELNMPTYSEFRKIDASNKLQEVVRLLRENVYKEDSIVVLVENESVASMLSWFLLMSSNQLLKGALSESNLNVLLFTASVPSHLIRKPPTVVIAFNSKAKPNPFYLRNSRLNVFLIEKADELPTPANETFEIIWSKLQRELGIEQCYENSDAAFRVVSAIDLTEADTQLDENAEGEFYNSVPTCYKLPDTFVLSSKNELLDNSSRHNVTTETVFEYLHKPFSARYTPSDDECKLVFQSSLFYNDAGFRNYLLLTHDFPLPGDIPDIKVYPRDVGEREITIQHFVQNEPLYLSREQFELVRLFQLICYSLIIKQKNTPAQTNKQESFYYLLPLDDKNEVDWEFLLQVASFEITRKSSVNFAEDELVLTDYNYNRYRIIKERADLNIDAELEPGVSYRAYYKNKYDINLPDSARLFDAFSSPSVKNLSLPVRNALAANTEDTKFVLVSDLLVKLPMSFKDFKWLTYLPTFLHRLENYLIVNELRANVFPGYQISLENLRYASTAPTMRDSVDYQLLETLGDSFVKFATSAGLFVDKLQAEEGALTKYRSRIVSNKNMYDIAVRLELYSYLLCNTLLAGQLVLPGIQPWIPARKNSTSYRPERKLIGNKMLADFVESLVGCLCLESHDLAFKFLHSHNMIKFKSLTELKPVTAPGIELGTLYTSKVENVEKVLGYTFQNKLIVIEAITHPSYRDAFVGSYERLEFLGDACLDFFITRYFYLNTPREVNNSFLMSELRQQVVSNASLGRIAVENEIDTLLLCDGVISAEIGKFVSVYRTNKQFWDISPFEMEFEAPKSIGDVFESLIGAVFVDTRYDLTRTFSIFERFLLPFIAKHCDLEKLKVNPVRLFFEKVQASGYRNNQVDFKFTETNTAVECIVSLCGRKLAEGSSNTKMVARRLAAANALEVLEKQPTSNKRKAQ